MKNEDTEYFFVQVKEPVKLKMHILESLKDIIENLQRFEKFSQIRDRKIEVVSRLRVLLRELIKLTSDLKSILPDSKTIKEIKPSKISRAQKPIAQKIKKNEESSKEVKKPKLKSQLMKLESELNQIEERLKSIR